MECLELEREARSEKPELKQERAYQREKDWFLYWLTKPLVQS